MYRKVKRDLDILLSVLGLILLSPLFCVLVIWIKCDSRGPVLFKQKRVGIHKKHFYILKFRTMQIDTPKDMPTHLLANPEQYITRAGRFLRKTSLDELPQIINILKGDMSIIGPRPALWNQYDLIAERDKYKANDILPGLTGWAQINGRDELEIPVKAKLDGEYTAVLRAGGSKAVWMDIRCFFGTIFRVLRHDGVLEGGTGNLAKNSLTKMDHSDAGFEEYGYLKIFHIDKSETNKKRVLITGAGSYIGQSFEAYAKKYYGANFVVDTVDMRDESWKEKDFSLYDTVFHVAGIAHADIGSVGEEEKARYYAVNTELAVETAEKCKKDGVRQFVFMSSMIVYGDSAGYGKSKVIREDTVPSPSNFYGDSKWQAEKRIRKLGDAGFQVAVLRPPMIYGKGAKGNYRTLAKLAKRLPVFPAVHNKRSMLYIENFCEFLCLLVLSAEGGIFFPQNQEYTTTADMVREIRKVSGKHIYILKLLNPVIAAGSHMPGKIGSLIQKAFGNSVYERKLSTYRGMEYCKVGFSDSIRRTEIGQEKTSKPVVLFLVNHDVVIYNFRLELVERLLKERYEVHISSPLGQHTEELKALGVVYHEIEIERHGINPIKELEILNSYKRLMKDIRPAVVLAYTIKPNIYGGIAARQAGAAFLANVTGLGTAIQNGGWKTRLVLWLYKAGLYHAHKVYFQNKANQKYMLTHGVVTGSYELLPGSGVNLDRHCYEPYPVETEKLVFTTIGRLMKDKGTDELLKAAKAVKQKYPSVRFRVIGFFDGDYQAKIESAVKNGVIEYIEQQKEIHPFIKETHAVIHPSYHEGMSNVLLEAAATGRPVLASKVPGCTETFAEGVSGFGFQAKDSADLEKVIERFIRLPYEEKEAMGKAGRQRMEEKFDRRIVVEKYMGEIRKILEER